MIRIILVVCINGKWNFEVLGMQIWNKSKDRAQRVDLKNGVKVFKKCLKSCLLPEFIKA